MKYLLLLLPLFLGCTASDSEKEKEASDPFPALAFIQSQVRHVDTSLYRITKIVTEGGKSDTTVIPREQFREEARLFLALEDISKSGLKEGYTESKIYDESLKRVVLFYTAKDPEAPIQRQQVIIDPNQPNGGAVSTFVIDVYETRDDFSYHRNLLWDVNREFQITENRPGPGGREIIRRTRVFWNDAPADHP